MFLEHARKTHGHANVEFIQGDVDRTQLPDRGFDFVHVRFVAGTARGPRGTLIEKRLIASDELDVALAACRAHLADPGTVFTTVTVAQVWGTRRKDCGVDRGSSVT